MSNETSKLSICLAHMKRYSWDGRVECPFSERAHEEFTRMGWDLINSFGTDEGFSGTSAEEVVGIHFGYDFKAFIYQHPFLFDDLMLVYLGTRYQWTKYEAKGEEYMRHRWKKQLPGLLRSIIMISGSVLHANRRNVIARVINTGAKQLLENWYLHDEMREELDGKGEEGQAA